MPVIVIGADTILGSAVIDALLPRDGEVRAFVTDAEVAPRLQARGVKVAVGDISDGSHVAGAALHTFCAVLVSDAAQDDRERSFAETPVAVAAAWAEGLRDAAVHRAIWLDDGSVPEARTLLEPAVAEVAMVGAAHRPATEIAAEVARLEAAPEV